MELCPVCNNTRKHRFDCRYGILEKQRDGLRDLILWALGENGDFPPHPDPIPGKPIMRYWWRNEMRDRMSAVLQPNAVA